MMQKKIQIFDTTLRDGEQSPGCSMNLGEKLEMARQLERLGVDIIEAGFPISSPDDFEAVREIARILKKSTVAALCRCVKGDIDRAVEALKPARHPRIHIFLATSEIHMKHKLKMTREEVLKAAREMVDYAKSLCDDIEFSAEDAFRSDRKFLLEVMRTVAAAGAKTINIPDTVGYATPQEMAELVTYIRGHIDPVVTISVHCHNDLGMAVANSLACIHAGATQIECTINGIGERAGNAAMEEIVMSIDTRKELFGATTNINTKELYRTSRLLSTITGIKVSPNKAIVGRNAFAHEAGIHQHGVLNNPATYEIMTPESVGIIENQMVLGKHSGKHAFAERVKELGFVLAPESIEEAFEKFKVLADKKKEITDQDIEALVNTAGYDIPETYTLVSFVVNSGTGITATAVVRLEKEGEEYEHVARGDGPIDAAFKAVDRIVKQGYPLKSYSIHAVTEGEDALGEVMVKVEKGSDIISGRGLSTDIIESSIKAYLNAINKALLTN